TVIFAYTVKGRGLATEGHPNNHAAQLTEAQLRELADLSGMSIDAPWQRFAPDSPEGIACAHAAARLARPAVTPVVLPTAPTELPWDYRQSLSTQAALGRFLSDIHRAEPELSRRIVTV